MTTLFRRSPLWLRPTITTTSRRFMASLTKTLAVLDLNELKDGQMKEVAFDSGKVLLSRIGDKVHATSAYCTHYGAPLYKGVLTSDARVVCPWHGACFNICTGDIEDAPAPSAIHSFKTQINDGKIYVTADPSLTSKEQKSRAPKLSPSDSITSEPGVVVVGGGSGTFYLIESLRENNYKGPITVLSKETHTPIDRTKLSKALITDATKVEWRSAADLKIKFGTTLRLGTEVISIDFDQKQVLLDDGKESVKYDKLVLAPGGTPRRLPIDGADLENVFTFRTIQDAVRVDNAAKEGKRMVVIGSSFISMEIVTACAKKGLKSIDVIGMESTPFEAILGQEVGAGIQKYHESQGVTFHMNSTVAKIVPSSSNPSLAGAVVVKPSDGGEETTLEADFVIMGVGVKPATDFIKNSGVELRKDAGVEVDEFLRVKGKGGDVYAIGDIAVYPGKEGPVRIEHWNVAGNHGRAVGKTIAGYQQPFVKIPVFWSAQGQQLRYCGLGAEYDGVYINGNPGEMKFVAYYSKQGKVVAVASMQNDPVVSKASELLRLDLMPSLQELHGGKNILEVDISSIKTLKNVA